MSAPMKRKAPAAPSTANKTAAAKKKTVAKKPAVKDQFDTDSSDDNKSDEELGVRVVQAVTTPKYSDYAKDINKTKLLTSSSSDDDSGDDNDDDDNNTLNIDKKYADKFNQRQANKVMSGQVQKFIDKVTKRAVEQEKSQARAEKRQQKKQRKLQRQKMAEELGLGQESTDEEELAMLGAGSETETEDEGFYDKNDELNFLSLLQGLKTRDAKIYDKNQVFFDEKIVQLGGDNSNNNNNNTQQQKGEKKMTYKQMMTDAAAGNVSLDAQDDDINARYHYGPLSGAVLTKDELKQQQEKLRQEFLKAVDVEEKKISKISTLVNSMNDDSESESDFDFTPKNKTIGKKTSGDDKGDDESDDDFFGRSTIISDPNAMTDSDSEDANDDEEEGTEIGVRDQSKLYQSGSKFIHDDIKEAKKVVQRLQKTANTGHNMLSVDLNTNPKLAKLSEKDRREMEEADKEKFLTKYILGGWWKNNDQDSTGGLTAATHSIPLPQTKDLFSEHKSMLLQSNLAKNDNDDEDEVIMVANDMYEQQLNFRFDDENDNIKEIGIASFPRAHLVADSLRQDMSKAKAQRLRQREQQKLEMTRQKELVKRLQAEQRKLAQTKIDAILKISGLHAAMNDSDEDGEDGHWTPADLLREFDPEEHDRKSNKMYGGNKPKKDQHDDAFTKVATADDFAVDSNTSDDGSSDDDSSSSDGDDGLVATKLNQKDKMKMLAALEAQKAQKHKEIAKRLDIVHEKTDMMRKNLPSLLKEQVKKQLELQKEKAKQTKDKRVTNFSSSSDDDSDSDDSDSDNDDKITTELYDSQLPADLKQLDRFEMEEEMISSNLKAQTDKQHKSMINDLNEVYVDPAAEAQSWWSQQKQRILSKPENQKRIAGVEGKKAKAELIADIIREELDQLEEQEGDSAVVDLNIEQRKMDQLTTEGGDNYQNVPSKKVAANPLLGGFRYQYITIPKADFGLSIEEILNSTDKELNEKVSMKKYFPYRDDNSDSRHYSEIQAEQARRYKEYVQSRGNKSKLSAEEFTAQEEDKKLAGRDYQAPVSRKAREAAVNRHKGNWSSNDAERAREFVAKNPQLAMKARRDQWMNKGKKTSEDNKNNTKPSYGKPGFNANKKPFDRKGGDSKPFERKGDKPFDRKPKASK